MADTTKPDSARSPAEIIHDLNNMIHIIGGYAGLIQATDVPGPTLQWAEEIATASATAADLVQEMMSVSRLSRVSQSS